MCLSKDLFLISFCFIIPMVVYTICRDRVSIPHNWFHIERCKRIGNISLFYSHYYLLYTYSSAPYETERNF